MGVLRREFYLECSADLQPNRGGHAEVKEGDVREISQSMIQAYAKILRREARNQNDKLYMDDTSEEASSRTSDRERAIWKSI